MLLVCGILTGIGAGIVFSGANPLGKAGQMLLTASMTARSRAMLRASPVRMQIDQHGVKIQASSDAHRESPMTAKFSGGVVLDSCNGEPSCSLIFQPIGLVEEHVVVLSRGASVLSVYVPATGSPKLLEGRYTLDQIRKEFF